MATTMRSDNNSNTLCHLSRQIGATGRSDSFSHVALDGIAHQARGVTAGHHRVDPKYLYTIPLIPVGCSYGLVKERPHEEIQLQPMARKQCKDQHGKLTVLFAIRRPGCGACREHGLQLSELASTEKDACFVGAIKHTGVDDKALMDFYNEYFKFPIYKDDKWRIFRAMGGRKIPLWKLLSMVPKLERRYKKKGIPNIPFGGDIFTQGGVLVFDRRGNLRHTYYETYGEEFDMEVLRQAIQEARNPL